MIFDQYPLLPYFDIRETRLSVDTSSALLIRANAQRIAIIFQNGGVNDIWVSTVSGNAVGEGLLIASGVRAEKLTFKDHGPLIGREWYAIADIMASAITVVETLYAVRNIGELPL